MERELQTHPFPPVYDGRSRILILGSFPSVKSREQAFFYGHPQNRFWRVLAAVLGEDVPGSIPEKTELLLRRGVALWDVVGRCAVAGSSDASIDDVTANDLSPILRSADIRAIFCNGAAAYTYYEKLCRAPLGRGAVRLPSTSPANARWTFERLAEAWGAAILPYL